MAKSRQSGNRNRQRKIERTRRKKMLKREKRRFARPSTKKLSPRLAAKLARAHELIDSGDFDDAGELLNHLAMQKPDLAAVVDTQLYLYQQTQDHKACCEAARKLMLLTPHDPDAVMMYAQESLFCGRAIDCADPLSAVPSALARSSPCGESSHGYRDVPTGMRKTAGEGSSAGFTDLTFQKGGLELHAQHETSLERLQNGDFESAISICQQILKQAQRSCRHKQPGDMLLIRPEGLTSRTPNRKTDVRTRSRQSLRGSGLGQV